MNDFDFDVEETSTSAAKEVEQTTGSKYEPLAEKWQTAREEGNAVVLRGVEKSDVDNIRNYFYRAFDKEDVIVRSKAQTDSEQYNVTIRPRENGEYLQKEDTTENGTVDTDEEMAEDTAEMEENGSVDTNGSTEETSIVDQAEADMEEDDEMEKADDFF